MKYRFISPASVLLIIAFLSWSLVVCAQGSYQRSLVYHAMYRDEVVGVVMHDSGLLLVRANGYQLTDTGTGAVKRCRGIGGFVYPVTAKSSWLDGDALYLGGSFGLLGDTAFVAKIDLATGAPTMMRKRLYSDVLISNIGSICGDLHGNLYLAGTTTDVSSGLSDMVVIKMDTGSNISWAKSMGVADWDETPSKIVYNNDSEIYLLATGFSSIYGKAIITRLDSAGSVLHTRVITATSGPRIASSTGTLVDGKLCIVFSTIVGPSDPGPCEIMILDSSLTTVHNLSIGGFSPQSISSSGGTILLSGQAPVSSGLKGFRSVRMDTTLAVISGRYFNKIATYSFATTSNCYLNSDLQSFHFFVAGAADTISMIKTDVTEAVNCNDTVFVPGTSSLVTADSIYSYVAAPLTVTTANLSLSGVAETAVSYSVCTPLAVEKANDVTPSISLYPNPTTGELYIDGPEKRAMSVFVCDVSGRQVFASKGDRLLDISSLLPGIYFVRVVSGRQVYVSRVVKE